MARTTPRQRIERDLGAVPVPHPDAATYAAMLDARDRVEAMIRDAAAAVDTIRHGLVARLQQEADTIGSLPEVLIDANDARDAMVEAIEEITTMLPDGDAWMRPRDEHAIDILDDGLGNAECAAAGWLDQHEEAAVAA